MKSVIRNKVREFLTENNETELVAGVLIKSKDTEKVLLLLRNDGRKEELWSFLTGGIEKDESVLEGLKREIVEEINIDPEVIDFKFIEEIKISKNKVLHYYEGLTNSEFKVILNDEHHEYGWFGEDELPSPLYPNTKEKIDKIWQRKK